MISTTYRNIEAAYDDPSFIEGTLAAATGSVATYGFDTPILMHNLVTNGTIGLTVILDALATSIDTNAINLEKHIGLDWCKSFLPHWLSLTGNTVLHQLLYFAEVILNGGIISESEVRIDYCGAVIDGGGIIGAEGLKTYLQQLSDYALSFPESLVTIPFYSWIRQPSTVTDGNGYVWAGATVQDAATNSSYGITRQSLSASDIPWYSPQNIDAIMAADPNHYYNESLTIDTQGLVVGTGWRLLKFNRIVPVADYRAAAVRNLAAAGIQATKMIIDLGFVNRLEAIFHFLFQAITDITVQNRLELMPKLSRIRELFDNWNHTYAGDTAYSDLEKPLRDLLQSRRAALLQDINYVKSFDTNLDGVLQVGERVALEVGAWITAWGDFIALASSDLTTLEAQELLYQTDFYENQAVASLVSVADSYFMLP